MHKDDELAPAIEAAEKLVNDLYKHVGKALKSQCDKKRREYMQLKEKQKAKALEFMQALDIYKPYINGFKNKDEVCMFERFGGYWVWQYPELEEKIKELEETNNCLVYAVTHEYTSFGECYDFLIVTSEEDEWVDLLYEDGGIYYAFAYCWNKDDEWCSEFGEIGLKSFGGGIARVA